MGQEASSSLTFLSKTSDNIWMQIEEQHEVMR